MRVRRETRLRYHRVDAAQTRGVLDQTESSQEPLRAAAAANELDRQHAAEAIEKRPGYFVVRMVFEPRIMHVPNLLAAVTPLGDSARVLVLSRDADVDRLEPALEEPAGEGIGRLPPHHHLLANLLDVRRGA